MRTLKESMCLIMIGGGRTQAFLHHDQSHTIDVSGAWALGEQHRHTLRRLHAEAGCIGIYLWLDLPSPMPKDDGRTTESRQPV